MKQKRNLRRITLSALSICVLGAIVSLAQKPEEKRKNLLENDRVRVREVLMEPGVEYAPHTHEYAHVGVILKGGTLQFTEKGKAESVTFKDGDAGWREAGVTHSIRNSGKTAVHVIEVELKR
jgi:mannose-6-phosphate isomerase-like protein (cupin superfamily)